MSRAKIEDWQVPSREQIVLCACGCGGLLKKYDKKYRERRFKKHHYPRVRKLPEPKEIECVCGCGQKLLDRNEKRRERVRRYIYHHFKGNQYTVLNDRK